MLVTNDGFSVVVLHAFGDEVYPELHAIRRAAVGMRVERRLQRGCPRAIYKQSVNGKLGWSRLLCMHGQPFGSRLHPAWRDDSVSKSQTVRIERLWARFYPAGTCAHESATSSR